MEVSLSNEMGPKWLILLSLIGIPVSFYLGSHNSILFYEYLPKTPPERGFLVFYQPGCPHCIAEIPEIKALLERGYRVSALNVYKYPDLAKKYGVTATPTIVVLPAGIKLVGEHDVNDLIDAYEEGISKGGVGGTCGVETYSCSAT